MGNKIIDEEVKKLLISLSKLILKRINKLKKNNLLDIDVDMGLEFKDTKWEIEDNPIDVFGHKTEYGNILRLNCTVAEFKKYNIKDKPSFAKDIFKSREYRSCLIAISNNYSQYTDFKDENKLLSLYIYHLISEILNRINSHQTNDVRYLEKQVDILINELKMCPSAYTHELLAFTYKFDVHVKMFIYGIKLTKDQFNLILSGHKIILRKPKDSDFLSSGLVQYDSPHTCSYSNYVCNNTSAIIEFDFRNEREDEEEDEESSILGLAFFGTRRLKRFEDNILEALRLYLSGSITYVLCEEKPLSLFVYGIPRFNQIDGILISTKNFQWTRNFQRFYNNIDNILVALSKGEINKFRYLYIAKKWYNDALLNQNDFEGIISSCIICLEALYLKDARETNLRLGLNVSSLFKHLKLKYNPIEVNNNLKKAHDIRSKYLHGSRYEGDKVKLKELTFQVLEYTKVSLQFFLQNKKEKDVIIDKLEQVIKSPYNKTLVDKLKKEISVDVILT